MNAANVYKQLRPRFEIIRKNTECEHGKKKFVVTLGVPWKKLTISVTKKGYVLFTLTDEIKDITFPSQLTLPRYAIANFAMFIASREAKFVLNA